MALTVAAFTAHHIAISLAVYRPQQHAHSLLRHGALAAPAAGSTTGAVSGDAWRGGGGARVGSVPAASPFRGGAAAGAGGERLPVKPFGHEHHLCALQLGHARV